MESTLEELLKAYPQEVRLKFREALERLRIVNKDDPILELMLVLGLWGVYYQKISGQVVEAGEQIELQNKAALTSLDERVRILQGLAQIIQQATDRLDTAGNDIVKRFTANEIARQVNDEIAGKLKAMRFGDLWTDLGLLSKNLEKVRGMAGDIEERVKRMESCTNKLERMPLPRFSLAWSAACIAFGAVITALGFWLFLIQPEMERQANFMRNEYYIGQRALSGMVKGQQVISVNAHDIDRYKNDDGNLTIWLKVKE